MSETILNLQYFQDQIFWTKDPKDANPYFKWNWNFDFRYGTYQPILDIIKHYVNIYLLALHVYVVNAGLKKHILATWAVASGG